MAKKEIHRCQYYKLCGDGVLRCIVCGKGPDGELPDAVKAETEHDDKALRAHEDK